MYLVGSDHPHKSAARRLLARVVTERQRLMTDAEVFQEILRRYVAIARRDAIQPAFDALLSVVDEVFPIEEQDVLLAKDIVATRTLLSARDAIHLAVMDRHGLHRIFSFDQGFDSVTGIERLPTSPNRPGTHQ